MWSAVFRLNSAAAGAMTTQFNRSRKNFAALVRSTLTVFWWLVLSIASGEFDHGTGGSTCSVSCNANPVDGAGQDRISWPFSTEVCSFFNEGIPATSTGMDVTSGWPVIKSVLYCGPPKQTFA